MPTYPALIYNQHINQSIIFFQDKLDLKTKNCYWTDYNEHKGWFKREASEHQVITGVESYYKDEWANDDRMLRYEICDVDIYIK